MDIFEEYSGRLGISGRSATDATINRSKNDADRLFHTSPSFYQVDIDGEITDTIINKTNDYKVKLIHFRYDYEAQIGSIVTFKDKKYLLLETDKDEVYLFGKMEECNGHFSIHTGEVERVEVGVDGFGRPIIEETPVTFEEPCIIQDKFYSINENAPLPLADGQLIISLKYQKAPNVKVNKEFVLYDNTYIITDVNYVDAQNEIGIMRIHAERRDDND